MTLAVAVICGVGVMTTSVKAETMYDETEDGVIVYENEGTVITNSLGDAQKLETPTNLRFDTTSECTTIVTWDRVAGASQYEKTIYKNGEKI